MKNITIRIYQYTRLQNGSGKHLTNRVQNKYCSLAIGIIGWCKITGSTVDCGRNKRRAAAKKVLLMISELLLDLIRYQKVMLYNRFGCIGGQKVLI